MPDYRHMQQPMPGIQHGKEEYLHLIDEICSTLMEGSILHEMSALHMFEYGYRGFGRLHYFNSKCDYEARLCLEKLAVDRLGHMAMIDSGVISKALTYTFSKNQLKEHLVWYLDREKEFSHLLTKAIKMAADYDMAVYEKLCKILSEVQEEMFRVKQITERLEAGGWQPHDSHEISRMIHRHHEKHDNMDYTLS